jgi:hypothetical protein
MLHRLFLLTALRYAIGDDSKLGHDTKDIQPHIQAYTTRQMLPSTFCKPIGFGD